MAAFDNTPSVTKARAGAFIPEIWSDEIIASYQKTLKMAPLVKKMTMTGKKGDTIHIPKPVRGTPTVKGAEAQVTLIANNEQELQVLVDRHFEYSRLIEDIADVQALSSMRQFYTEDAGYALATQVDADLHAAATGFGNGTRTYSPTDTGTSFAHNAAFFNNDPSGTRSTEPYAVDTVVAGDVFTDDFFRDMIQKMDDNDIPMDQRVLVIPPSARNQIMGINRYVSSDFVGGQPVASGLIGNLYGVDVYVSSNCGLIESATENNAGAGPAVRAGLLFHRDAIVMAEQLGVRTQTQYKQEYLANLFTADTLYGVETYRPEAGFVLALPDVA